MILQVAEAKRAARSISEATALLTSFAGSFESDAEFQLQLACYHSVNGEVGAAQNALERAFRHDSSIRLRALESEDLKALWDSLGMN